MTQEQIEEIKRQLRLEKAREYYMNNRDRLKLSHDDWVERNRERYREYQRKYRQLRRAEDPEFKKRTDAHCKVSIAKRRLKAKQGDQS